MRAIRRTESFIRWFDDLRDERACARIRARVRRLSLGNPGDVKPVGEGVSEMRVDCGPGYRIYYVQRGEEIILLLAGGTKKTQQKDVALAIRLSKEL